MADCPYRVIGKEAQYCPGGSISAPTPTPRPVSGLQGCWALEETGGQRLDSSGQGNHLADNNTVAVTSGKVGRAADFESGNREYLSIADGAQSGLDVSGSLTLVGWMKLETGNRWQILAGKYEYGVNNRAYRLDLRPGNLVGFAVSPNGSLTSGMELAVSPVSTLTPGVWYHVAGVFDADQRTLAVTWTGNC
jgi:hypothetical protein